MPPSFWQATGSTCPQGTRGSSCLPPRPNIEFWRTNTLDADDVFNASPAVVGNQLLLRTDRKLYCIGR